MYVKSSTVTPSITTRIKCTEEITHEINSQYSSTRLTVIYLVLGRAFLNFVCLTYWKTIIVTCIRTSLVLHRVSDCEVYRKARHNLIDKISIQLFRLSDYSYLKIGNG